MKYPIAMLTALVFIGSAHAAEAKKINRSQCCAVGYLQFCDAGHSPIAWDNDAAWAKRFQACIADVPIEKPAKITKKDTRDWVPCSVPLPKFVTEDGIKGMPGWTLVCNFKRKTHFSCEKDSFQKCQQKAALEQKIEDEGLECEGEERAGKARMHHREQHAGC
jgi:hypothetical protein